jgi:hypothetical protein
MAASSLPIDLRRLANHARICAVRGIGMTPDECGRVAVLLDIAVKEADLVVGQAELMPELEDELHAVACDLDRVTPAPVATGYQAALKAQQLQLQRELDGEPDHVSRPGLAALATPVGDTNVVLMPIAPRPRPLGGGDAA